MADILSFSCADDDDSIVSERAEATLRSMHDSLSASLPKGKRRAEDSATLAKKGAYRPEASRSQSRLSTRDREEVESIIGSVSAASLESESASFQRQSAVPLADMYGPGACAICEETMAFQYHKARTEVGAGRKASDKLVSIQARQRERLSRQIQARANMAEGDQGCHRVLFGLEHALRGRWSDKRIFDLLLVLRREWIEKKLEYYGIDYVPWTRAALEAHFNPANKHFDQPLRRTITEYDKSTEMLDLLFAASNQGGTIDYRGVAAFQKQCELQFKYRESIRTQLEQAEPDIAEILRQFTEAVARTTRDAGAQRVTQDPESAAGRAPTVYEPHSNYSMNNLSAN